MKNINQVRIYIKMLGRNIILFGAYKKIFEIQRY